MTAMTGSKAIAPDQAKRLVTRKGCKRNEKKNIKQGELEADNVQAGWGKRVRESMTDDETIYRRKWESGQTATMQAKAASPPCNGQKWRPCRGQVGIFHVRNVLFVQLCKSRLRRNRRSCRLLLFLFTDPPHVPLHQSPSGLP